MVTGNTASSALICVHGNLFNRSTIDEETTLLFKTREDIKTIIDTIEKDKNNGRLKKGLHHSDELAKPVESTNGPSTPNEDETFSDYNKKKQHLNKLKLVINGSEHPSIQKNLNIIKSRFLWEDIVNDHADVLQQLSKP